MSASGRNVTVVPVAPSPGSFAPFCSSFWGAPREYSCDQSYPSRRISTSSRSDSALTTETPTPCRPPETL